MTYKSSTVGVQPELIDMVDLDRDMWWLNQMVSEIMGENVPHHLSFPNLRDSGIQRDTAKNGSLSYGYGIFDTYKIQCAYIIHV